MNTSLAKQLRAVYSSGRLGIFDPGKLQCDAAKAFWEQLPHTVESLDARAVHFEGNCASKILKFVSGETEAAAVSLRSAVETASAQGAGWLELRALHSLASRFPDQTLREQLGDRIETIPSGHDLPAFRAATGLLSESG